MGTIPVTSTDKFTAKEHEQVQTILADLKAEDYKDLIAGVTIVKTAVNPAVTLNDDKKAVIVTTIADLKANLDDGKTRADKAQNPNPEPTVIDKTFGSIPVKSTDFFTATEREQVQKILEGLTASEYEGLVASVTIVKTAVDPAVTLNDDKQAVITTTIAELTANLDDGKTKADAAQNPGTTEPVINFVEKRESVRGDIIEFLAEEGVDHETIKKANMGTPADFANSALWVSTVITMLDVPEGITVNNDGTPFTVERGIRVEIDEDGKAILYRDGTSGGSWILEMQVARMVAQGLIWQGD